jgi:hypothetical protein
VTSNPFIFNGDDVDVAVPTVNGHFPEGVPPDPLRTCTVKEPAARVAEPVSVTAERVGVTTQAVLVEHPGPKKNTSALEVL